MNSKASEIDIRLIAKDIASQTIKNVNSQIRDTGKASMEAGKGNQSLVSQMVQSFAIWETFKGILRSTIGLLKAIPKQFVELGKRGGELEGISRGFVNNFGDMDKALSDLRKGAQGTISDFDLMLSANKAAMLGVTKDSKQLARLLEVARGRAQALGIDSTQAFSDIVTGIGRNSPLILDNLGIVTKSFNAMVQAIEGSDEAFTKQQKSFIKSAGITVKQFEEQGRVFDDTQKKQLLLNDVLKDNIQATDTAKDATARLEAQFTNIKDSIAQGLAPVLGFLASLVSQAISKFNEWIAEFSAKYAPQINRIKELFRLLRDNIISLLGASDSAKNNMKSLAEDGFKFVLDSVEDLLKKLNDFIVWLQSPDGQQAITDLTNTVKDLTKAWLGGVRVVGFLIEKFRQLGEVGKWVGGILKIMSPQLAMAQSMSNALSANVSSAGATVGSSIGAPVTASGFADGGIIGGNSYSGDRMLARVNSGEMVLNKQQQAALFGMINGGGKGGNVTINVNGANKSPMQIAKEIQRYLSNQNKLANYNLS